MQASEAEQDTQLSQKYTYQESEVADYTSHVLHEPNAPDTRLQGQSLSFSTHYEYNGT